MLIYRLVTSRPLIFPQIRAVSSPCNFTNVLFPYTNPLSPTAPRHPKTRQKLSRSLPGSLGRVFFVASLTLQSLFFFEFLVFFFVFLCAFFLSFPRILGVRRREKPLFFFCLGFPLLLFKKARAGGSGKFAGNSAESLRKFAKPKKKSGVFKGAFL